MAAINPPYKIMQVIDWLDIGGAERVMLDITNILVEKGQEVTSLSILHHGALGKYVDPRVNKVDLHRKSRFSIRALKKFSKLARQHDVIHVHMRHNLKFVVLARLLFPFNTKVIFHDHYGKINTDPSLSRSLRWAIKNVTYIGVSNELTDWARHVANIPDEKVYTLSNIIRKNREVSERKLHTDHAKLVMVANIREQKNIVFALELIHELAKQRTLTFTLYGAVIDASYLHKLKALVKKFDLEDRVNFVHDCADIQSELYQYDLALHTAATESGPLVLIEYLCQSLPFITYNTGEVVQRISHDLSELVLNSFEHDDWLNKIRKLLDQPPELPLQRVYDKHFSEEKYFGQCMQIYQKSLAN